MKREGEHSPEVQATIRAAEVAVITEARRARWLYRLMFPTALRQAVDALDGVLEANKKPVVW